MVRLEQKISLQLRQSPQQVLFSTLLQMPLMALEQKLKTELQLNPLLEEVDEIDEELNIENEPIDRGENLEPDEEKDEDNHNEENEIEWEEILNDQEEYDTKMPKDYSKEEFSRPDPSPVSLAEHLLSQLRLYNLSEKEILLGEYIIWNIDEDGYLSLDIESIADSLDFSIEKVEEILKLVQTFDPKGIAARNLQECLLIQLEEEPEKNQLPIKIVKNHFNDFKNKRFEKIAKSLELPIEEIRNAIETIKKLNPKPGEGYFDTNENYIIPDFIVEKVGDDFIVSLNEGNSPHLQINEAYKKLLLDKKGTPKETRNYIKRKLESARWLINSIQQRKITMLSVMNEIVERQKEFFEKGPGNIKPMILKDIAHAIGMDISTISRVTNGKYVQTDYGVLELKYFFSEKMKSINGDEISTHNIKAKIKDIIEDEDKNKPLTDGQIEKELAKEGLPIARRTVAKYREQLGIPIARLRRKI